LQEVEVLEKERQKEHGLGRPVISTLVDGVRIVAVGDRIYRSQQGKWKTFHDFLFSYIRSVLGGKWADDELKKTRASRHELLNWYESTAHRLRSAIRETDRVFTMSATAEVSAFLDLAYHLYLIAHNIGLPKTLLHRLKNAECFLPAAYEAMVASAFIKAGFQVEFENEGDSTRDHCEFVAVFPATKKKFAVEAKLRRPGKTSADLGNQLYAALRKSSPHTRIVFIELNLPGDMDGNNRPARLSEVLQGLRTREDKLTIEGDPAPPAYVVVTNHPHYYAPDAPFQKWVLAEGFKIPDFKFEGAFQTLRDALDSRERHTEMTNLMQSFADQASTPSTFDGKNPDLVFGKAHARLTIGQKYRLPSADGSSTMGELFEAVVLEKDQSVYGLYKCEDGIARLYSCPLTDDEFRAYLRHPDTFFGKVRSTSNRMHTPLELYDWLLATYSGATKKEMLKLLSSASDFDALQELPRNELIRIFCERAVHAVVNEDPSQQPGDQSNITKVGTSTSNI
jgi:hypothetical protein